jgi:hypothetical protein
VCKEVGFQGNVLLKKEGFMWNAPSRGVVTIFSERRRGWCGHSPGIGATKELGFAGLGGVGLERRNETRRSIGPRGNGHIWKGVVVGRDVQAFRKQGQGLRYRKKVEGSLLLCLSGDSWREMRTAFAVVRARELE